MQKCRTDTFVWFWSQLQHWVWLVWLFSTFPAKLCYITPSLATALRLLWNSFTHSHSCTQGLVKPVKYVDTNRAHGSCWLVQLGTLLNQDSLVENGTKQTNVTCNCSKSATPLETGVPMDHDYVWYHTLQALIISPNYATSWGWYKIWIPVCVGP